MASTWIESAAKGRNGGPVRAGVWAAVVIGTHPVEPGQRVWLEIQANDVHLGPLPGYWAENRGVNSLWHVPIPPQGVGTRLHYRSVVHSPSAGTLSSPYQDTIVRPNLPDRTESPEVVSLWPEGLVGNQRMTVRVDGRGSTQDIYFPTVGLHSNIRPAEGDLPQSRSHFRAILGGLSIGPRLDWFNERLAWEVFQGYQGATNLLRTELNWRKGPVRVVITDFAANGDCLPLSTGGIVSSGQYLKRFRVTNNGTEDIDALFGLYVAAEVNGGIGEPTLSWQDGDRALLAANRGHGHVNRKLARAATVEFAIALDENGSVHCEPTGPDEAVLLRQIHVPAGGVTQVDVLVSGAFTGWRGDPGTFEHWIRPALQWFRSSDIDEVEQCSAQSWDTFTEPLPNLAFPKPAYGVALRRSALAAALHTDATHGAIASGYDRGLSAYCWPREAVLVGETFDRLGQTEIAQGVYRWLGSVKGQDQAYSYWFQKYSIDGHPEWETPAIDQTALIPWGIERQYRRSGDLGWVEQQWATIERAASVCSGSSGHPGLSWIDDISLIRSAGLWDSRYGAFLYSNCCVVAGLKAAGRLAQALGREQQAAPWFQLADRIWEQGILGEVGPNDTGPGLVDAASGRFLEARRVSKQRGLWADRPEDWNERSAALDISMLGAAVPLGLLPADDRRLRKTAEEIFKRNALSGSSHLLRRWADEKERSFQDLSPSNQHAQDLSTLATLWMSRYLIELGRTTGDPRHWALAVSMLDTLMGRLAPLGLAIRSLSKVSQALDQDPGTGSGVWGLHAMLIETMLDLAGLEYDAVDRKITLQPVLPVAWPSIGMSRRIGEVEGEVSYRFERAVGTLVHHLEFKANLLAPLKLDVRITCPGLTKRGRWTGSPLAAEPTHNPHTGTLTWSLDLPAGQTELSWTWG